MAKLTKQEWTIAIIMLLIAGIAIIILAGQQGFFSVITSTSSIVPLEYEGVTKDYVALNLNIADFQPHTLTFKVAERSDGTYIHTPQDPEIKMDIQKTSELCTYPTQSQTIGYSVGTAQPEVKVNINLNGNAKTLTLSDTQQNFEVSNIRNNGVIYAKVNGIITQSNCPDMSNTKIMSWKDNYYLINKDNVGTFTAKCVGIATIPLLGIWIDCNINDIKDNLIYSEIQGNIQFDKSVLKVKPARQLGALNMDIKADAEVFAFKSELINKVADPEILTLECGDVKEGEKSSMVVEVVDQDRTGNTINVMPSSNEVTFTPVNLDNLPGKYYFTMTGKTTTVNKNIDIKITAKACDVGICNEDVETFSGKCELRTSGGITPSSCGNGICESFENANTCANDCLKGTCKENAIYSASEQKCVCIDGYEQTAKGECEKPPKISGWLLIITIVLAGIASVLMYSWTPTLSGIKVKKVPVGKIFRWVLIGTTFIVVFILIPTIVNKIADLFRI